MTELISIKKSSAKNKKYTATFKNAGKEKKIHFGALGYLDYTIGATKQQRENYRSRHAKDQINKGQTAGALSYYILWGDSKDIQTNIKHYKNKFNY
jgi:hypothetical protein